MKKPKLVEQIDSLLLDEYHILLFGPAGSGKTMLGKRIHTRKQALLGLPKPLALEIGQIWWSSKLVQKPDWQPVRPFRAPHHTVSKQGMVGRICYKCNSMKPVGEMVLAHGGTLFLDEIEEFRKDVLEAVLEPIRWKSQLGRGIIRVGEYGEQPAEWTLVATASDESMFARRVPQDLRKRMIVLTPSKEEITRTCEWVDSWIEPARREDEAQG